MRHLRRALWASLLIHLLLAGGLWQVPADWASPPAVEIAEIQIVERPADLDDKTKNLVRQADPPEKILVNDESKARFLSEQRQRVLLETQARRTGMTQNGSPLPADSWMNETRPLRGGTKSDRRAVRMDGYEPIPLPRPNDARAFADAPSMTGELLPNDVSIGDFTSLNTDRFQFYSFYSRVEELVRFRWESSVKQAVDRMDARYLRDVVGRRNWVTSIEFWLTPDGRFHSAHILKESGVKRFDEAAVFAFRDARIFPNPPPEMVGSDGYIHLLYTFNVHWTPSTLGSR